MKRLHALSLVCLLLAFNIVFWVFFKECENARDWSFFMQSTLSSAAPAADEDADDDDDAAAATATSSANSTCHNYRISLCIAGLRRTFEVNRLRANIRRALIDPIGAACVDVFLLLRRLPNASDEYRATLDFSLFPTKPEVTDDFGAYVKEFNAVSFEFKMTLHADQRLPKAVADRLRCRAYRFEMWEDMAACGRALERYEHFFPHHRATHVIRARPDVGYRRALPPLSAWPPPRAPLAAYEGDEFAILSRNVASQLFNTSQRLLDHCDKQHSSDQVNNERIFEESIRLALKGADDDAARRPLRQLVRIVRPCEAAGRTSGGVYRIVCVDATQWNALDSFDNETVKLN